MYKMSVCRRICIFNGLSSLFVARYVASFSSLSLYSFLSLSLTRFYFCALLESHTHTNIFIHSACMLKQFKRRTRKRSLKVCYYGFTQNTRETYANDIDCDVIVMKQAAIHQIGSTGNIMMPSITQITYTGTRAIAQTTEINNKFGSNKNHHDRTQYCEIRWENETVLCVCVFVGLVLVVFQRNN